jgi:signal transduction histidine kinase
VPEFDFLCLHAPECVDHVKSRLERHMKGDELEPCELTLVTKAGKRLEALLATRLVPYDGGRAILGIVTDISYQKRVQTDLERRRRQLREMAMRLTQSQEAERRRLAAWLHDELGQTLTALGLKIAEGPKASTPESAAKAASEAAGILSRITEQVREETYELESPTLGTLGLGEALDELCERMAARFGMDFDYESQGDVGTGSAELDTALYHAVRELLHNVAKHAEATRAVCRATRLRHRVRVEVEDNGKGFDPTGIDNQFGRTGGFGLYRIRDRIDYLGGTVRVESSPGKGTCVVIDMRVEGSP